MPVFKNCVTIDGKLYCYDRILRRVVEAEIRAKDNQTEIPIEIEKLVLMKEFGLTDNNNQGE